MNYTAFIGIDPGLRGGIAIIKRDVYVIPILLAGDELDIPRMKSWIEKIVDISPCIVGIEKVHSMPEQGVSSSFKFGLVTGELRGMIKAMELPLVSISPQTWKKSVLIDTDKSKEAAVAFCRNLYPQITLLATDRSKKPHSGMAEALCIAHYVRMLYSQD